MFRENSKYEILTPTGWKDFKGVMIKGVQPLIKITLSDGNSISATEGHSFFDEDGSPIITGAIVPGTKLKTEDGLISVSAVQQIGEDTVYDLVEVFDKNHQFIVQSKVITKNCDEFAFVRPNMASEFWTSIQPVLSTGGSCIITSTPKNDEDQFAQIWKGAINNTDDFGNELPNGRGKNGFFPIKVKWDEHPDRDEEWAAPFRASLGDAKFQQEFECLQHGTTLDIIDAEGTESNIAIGNLFNYLKEQNNTLASKLT